MPAKDIPSNKEADSGAQIPELAPERMVCLSSTTFYGRRMDQHPLLAGTRENLQQHLSVEERCRDFGRGRRQRGLVMDTEER